MTSILGWLSILVAAAVVAPIVATILSRDMGDR